MNRERRKQLTKAFEMIEEAWGIIEDVKDDEEEAKENLPDNFKYGERGEEMDGYIEMMEEAIGYLQDANSVIEQI